MFLLNSLSVWQAARWSTCLSWMYFSASSACHHPTSVRRGSLPQIMKPLGEVCDNCHKCPKQACHRSYRSLWRCQGMQMHEAVCTRLSSLCISNMSMLGMCRKTHQPDGAGAAVSWWRHVVQRRHVWCRWRNWWCRCRGCWWFEQVVPKDLYLKRVRYQEHPCLRAHDTRMLHIQNIYHYCTCAWCISIHVYVLGKHMLDNYSTALKARLQTLNAYE